LSRGGQGILAPFRDRALVGKVAREIAAAAKGGPCRIMHVCGTHEWAITHAGLRGMLPEGVEVVAGPGCPVCVTPGGEIDALAELACGRAAVTTFGDVVRVAGRRLRDDRAEGCPRGGARAAGEPEHLLDAQAHTARHGVPAEGGDRG